MTMFMDTHPGTDMPSDLRARLQERVRTGEKDAHGVIDRGIILDEERGEMHCILDAPDEDAVRAHHQSVNVPLEEHTLRRADAILTPPEGSR